MLKQRSVLLAKIEATYKTDPVPTGAADAILCEGLAYSFDGARKVERSPLKTSLAKLKSIQAGSLMQVTFDVEIKGSGAAGTPPEMSPLLQACGLAETIVASTSVGYLPASTGIKSCALYLYEDGIQYKILGCRGTAAVVLQTGAAGKVSFTMKGHYSGPTDTALATPTYDSTVPVPLIGVPFTIGGYAAVISKLGFDLGNTIATPDDISSADGYAAVQITGRNVTGSIDPEAVLVAAHDFVTNWRNGTGLVLTTGVIGATPGNRFKVDGPVVVYSEIGNGDRSGIVTRDIKVQFVESTTDDEISLLFT